MPIMNVSVEVHLMLLKATKSETEYLAQLLNSIEPKIYRAFIQAMNSVKNSKVIDEIVQLLNQGQVDKAFSIIEKTINNFTSETVFFYVVAGQAAASNISGVIGINLSFNQTNHRAVQVMQAAHLRLVRDITNEQRSSLREALIDNIARGINPNNMANVVRNSIGLTTKQVQAVNRYRSLLESNSRESLSRELRDRRFDPTVDNAISTRTLLSTSQIDRMVERYAERQLDYRARTVARTEALRAVHLGSDAMFEQAVESGDLTIDEMESTWWTAADEKVRSSHTSMHGQVRPYGQPFISGDGNSLMYPGDINAPASEVVSCRCIKVTTLKRR